MDSWQRISQSKSWEEAWGKGPQIGGGGNWDRGQKLWYRLSSLWTQTRHSLLPLTSFWYSIPFYYSRWLQTGIRAWDSHFHNYYKLFHLAAIVLCSRSTVHCNWTLLVVLIRFHNIYPLSNDNRMGLTSGSHFQISHTSNRKIVLFVVDDA